MSRFLLGQIYTPHGSGVRGVSIFNLKNIHEQRLQREWCPGFHALLHTHLYTILGSGQNGCAETPRPTPSSQMKRHTLSHTLCVKKGYFFIKKTVQRLCEVVYSFSIVKSGHFEIWRGKTRLNPVDWLKRR